jgi:RNA polymerase sigma-70 factor, ECF subfamily
METQDYRKAKDFETSDNILVHQALSGDQEAFEALVSRYQRALFRLIYRYVGEYHEAHDVLQQVWLQLYLSLPTLDPHGGVKPWLFTVARHRSVDFLRRRRLLFFSELETENEEDETAYLDSIPDTSPMPEEVVEHRDLQREIQYAIYSLPCVPRTVVSLYYNQQMNYAEIGQMLKMPVSTVKARFHRAKPFLHATLQHNRSST